MSTVKNLNFSQFVSGVLVVTVSWSLSQHPDITASTQAWIKPKTVFYEVEQAQTNTEAAEAYNAKEIVTWLREEGLPVAAIADISKVERKSVYAWLNGGHTKEHNLERLINIRNLLSEGKQADLRSLYRLWNRQVANNQPLKVLLSQEKLDIAAIKETLTALWPVAKKYMEIDKLRPASTDIGNNPILAEMREAYIPSDDL